MKNYACYLCLSLLVSGLSAQLPSRTVASLDQARCISGELQGKQFLTTDGISATDCLVGGAAIPSVCICDSGVYRSVASGYVSLAGDADGQAIQGITGANQARVDIGVTDASGVRLIGTGATPGFIYAYTDGVFASSPDLGTDLDIYDGGAELQTSGDAAMWGDTSSIFGTGASPTTLQGVTVSIKSQQTPPTNANDACTAGDTIDTATFHYYCHATNTWVRVAMATW